MDTEGLAGTERATLREFLDYQRQALIRKLEGLTEEQARAIPTASSLSLLSVVKHSAVWERRWFEAIIAGRTIPDGWPDGPDTEPDEVDLTFQLADSDTVETVIAEYRERIGTSNEILGRVDLGAPCARTDIFDEKVRWAVVHMIEETARHAGHADIIRETIDGTRGI